MAHLLMRLFEKWPALNALAPSILYVYIDVDRADCSPPWGGRTLEGNEGEKGNSSFAARRVEYYYVVFSVRGPASKPRLSNFSHCQVTKRDISTRRVRYYQGRLREPGRITRMDIPRSVCDQVFFLYSTGRNFISKVLPTEFEDFSTKKNYTSMSIEKKD